MSLTQINKAGLDEIALDHVFTIGAYGSSAYTFQGEGLNGTVNNPTLYLTRGKTYRFENGTGAHPIRIQSTSGASGTAYNTGVTNNAGSGTVIVEVQHDAPDVLYYQCTSHAAMNGILYITGALADGGVTTAKIGNNQVTADKLADVGVIDNPDKIGDNNITTAKIADQAVTLAKLPHGTSSNNGKFLRANNGADPTFETVNTDLVSDTSPQLGGDLQSNGSDIDFADNDKAIFGTGGDLQIYHDPQYGHSWIKESGSGGLIFSSNVYEFYNASVNEKLIRASEDGAVELFHDNNKKLTTTSTGIDINTGGSYGGSSIKLYGNDVIKGSNWGYSTAYKGIIIGRTDNNVNSSIFMGVDPSGNTSGAFGGTGNEMIFRNDLSFYHPNNANNNWKTFMRLGQFGDTGAVRFNNGLGFGNNTATANILDDYEEGSFTPVLENDGSTSYTHQEGRYVKIGRLVQVNIFVKINNEDGGATSVTGIDNMPFANGASHVITFIITGNNGWDANLSSTNFAGWMPSGSSKARFYKNSGGNLNGISVNDIGSDGEIAISVTYQT